MGTLFVEHFDSHAEGLGDHEDVAEDYGGVEEASVALDGLEGDCGGEFGVATDGEEVIGAFGFVVLWEVLVGAGAVEEGRTWEVAASWGIAVGSLAWIGTRSGGLLSRVPVSNSRCRGFSVTLTHHPHRRSFDPLACFRISNPIRTAIRQQQGTSCSPEQQVILKGLKVLRHSCEYCSGGVSVFGGGFSAMRRPGIAPPVAPPSRNLPSRPGKKANIRTRDSHSCKVQLFRRASSQP